MPYFTYLRTFLKKECNVANGVENLLLDFLACKITAFVNHFRVNTTKQIRNDMLARWIGIWFPMSLMQKYEIFEILGLCWFFGNHNHLSKFWKLGFRAKFCLCRSEIRSMFLFITRKDLLHFLVHSFHILLWHNDLYSCIFFIQTYIYTYISLFLLQPSTLLINPTFSSITFCNLIRFLAKSSFVLVIYCCYRECFS